MSEENTKHRFLNIKGEVWRWIIALAFGPILIPLAIYFGGKWLESRHQLEYGYIKDKRAGLNIVTIEAINTGDRIIEELRFSPQINGTLIVYSIEKIDRKGKSLTLVSGNVSPTKPIKWKGALEYRAKLRATFGGIVGFDIINNDEMFTGFYKVLNDDREYVPVEIAIRSSAEVRAQRTNLIIYSLAAAILVIFLFILSSYLLNRRKKKPSNNAS